MRIIIINVKSLLEGHFWRISINKFENKLTFVKKNVLHTTTLLHCKARQVLRNLFSTNQGNGSEMAFVAESTKVYLEKPSYDCMS